MSRALLYSFCFSLNLLCNALSVLAQARIGLHDHLLPQQQKEHGRYTLPFKPRPLSFPMALRLVIHTLFMLLVCIASPRIVTSPQKGTNGIDSLNLSVPESHVTTLNQSTSSGSFWSAQHASNKPVKIDTSLIPAGNVHNLTNLHLATPRIQCDGSAYGLGLQIASCIDAWGLIPTDTIRRTFGKRTLGTFDVPLPLRLFSSEYNPYTTCCCRS